MAVVLNSSRWVLVLVSVLAVMLMQYYACGMDKGEKSLVGRTALEDYAHEEDYSWDWTLEAESWQNVLDTPKTKVKIYQVSMVSQRWSAGVKHGVSEPFWWHKLTIYRPERVRSEKAFLFIGGGVRYSRYIAENTFKSDILNSAGFARLAANTGAVVIDLTDVPNQYLCFSDGIPRKEDDLVAWTWNKFLQHPDENTMLPLQFPMVKSVVRAMDTVQAVLSDKGVNIESFVLSGASKRGGIAWLTAAVDARTDSLIPVVIDNLKGDAFMDHVYKTHQGKISALSDYYAMDHDIAFSMDTPEAHRLLMLVDPYSYRDRLSMPKYIITASGDDFFPPDSTHLYLDDMKGLTWLRTLPNSRHYVFRESEGRERMIDIFEAFLGARVENRMLPTVSWSSARPGQLSASMDTCPTHATLWQVTNPEARDFRMTALSENDLQYEPTKLTINDMSFCQFAINMKAPASGWTAWFVEFVFDNAPYPDIVLTSKVSVIPDLYPTSCKASQGPSVTCMAKTE